MKILFDECVTKKLKKYFFDFEVYTVTEMGWSGVKNGKLMTLCVEYNFDVLLTIDKNLMYQQNLEKYPLSIAVFNCTSSQILDLVPLVDNFKVKVKEFEKHKAYLINSNG